MYTFEQWGQFCQDISTNERKINLVVSEGVKKLNDAAFIIKHDVEDRADLAYEIATIESKWGIKSTYYFHGFFLNSKDSINIMLNIQDMGHEVGYHYDVLDICNGDYNKALILFLNDLERFKANGIKISTICPHGNPVKIRSGWNSNKDFFKSKAVRDECPALFDVVNDIELFGQVKYISDAGFKLQLIGDIRNNDKKNTKNDSPIALSSLLHLDDKVILSVHTHRMRKYSFVLNSKKYLFLTLKSVVGLLAKTEFVRRLLNPFFRLAKKF